MRMYKIAVLGDRDSVLGFRALGLDVFFADDAETGRKACAGWRRRATP